MTQGEGFGRALLVACDLSGYGSGDDQLQEAMQEALVTVLDEAAGRARLVRSEWDRESTGDGELALLPATESEPRVVDDFVRELAAVLARRNWNLADRARLRLRVAVHYGVAYPASNGYAGQGVVVVSRLLDSTPIRQVMRQSDTELALIISNSIYSDIVLNGHTSFRPQDFRRVAVRVKEFSDDAWIWLPHGDVHNLSITDDYYGQPDRQTKEFSTTNPPPADAGNGVDQSVSARSNFYGTVIAPGSVFGIDLSGRRCERGE